jgi:hypothetical protein
VSDEPVPIREGITPEFDLEFELKDFFQRQLNYFRDAAEQPPTRVAVVLMGKGKNGNFHSRVRSWDTEEKVCRLENCSAASALLLHEAIRS